MVINRLVLRRHFAIAIEVCKYLNIPEVEGNTKILLYWALYKVKQIDIDDETIAKIIANKLGEASGISYAEIARCAIQSGRPNLAIKVINFILIISKTNFLIKAVGLRNKSFGASSFIHANEKSRFGT